MVKSTEDILRAACRSDSTITPEQVRAALDVLRGRTARAVTNASPLDRVLSRDEVAGLTGKSAKQIDVLCRRGVLRRIYAKDGDGRQLKRAAGIAESSYRAFVAGLTEAEYLARTSEEKAAAE